MTKETVPHVPEKSSPWQRNTLEGIIIPLFPNLWFQCCFFFISTNCGDVTLFGVKTQQGNRDRGDMKCILRLCYNGHLQSIIL